MSALLEEFPKSCRVFSIQYILRSSSSHIHSGDFAKVSLFSHIHIVTDGVVVDRAHFLISAIDSEIYPQNSCSPSEEDASSWADQGHHRGFHLASYWIGSGDAPELYFSKTHCLRIFWRAARDGPATSENKGQVPGVNCTARSPQKVFKFQLRAHLGLARKQPRYRGHSSMLCECDSSKTGGCDSWHPFWFPSAVHQHPETETRQRCCRKN